MVTQYFDALPTDRWSLILPLNLIWHKKFVFTKKCCRYYVLELQSHISQEDFHVLNGFLDTLSLRSKQASNYPERVMSEWACLNFLLYIHVHPSLGFQVRPSAS